MTSGPREHKWIRTVPLRLVHAEATFLVVDKLPGVSVIGVAAPLRAAVVKLGIGQPPGQPLRCPHRIDKNASGLVLLARTGKIARALAAQFEGGRAWAEFEVLVRGFVPQEQGTLENNLVFDKRAARVRSHDTRGGPARTEYRLLQRVAGHSLLECRAIPGLPHQLRVQWAQAGYPLGVDPRYGGGERILLSEFKRGYRQSRLHEEHPILSRLSLHLSKLHFVHPETAQELDFEAGPARDLRAAVRQLAAAL